MKLTWREKNSASPKLYYGGLFKCKIYPIKKVSEGKYLWAYEYKSYWKLPKEPSLSFEKTYAKCSECSYDGMFNSKEEAMKAAKIYAEGAISLEVYKEN